MDPERFAEDYYQRLVEALAAFDRRPLRRIAELLEDLRRRGGTLYVAGNGGSAAICEHLVCDATKGARGRSGRSLRAVCLSSNAVMMTALANDRAYRDVFREQLRYYLRPGDAALFVSSSGSSPNVVEACHLARARGVPTIAFVGFDGGALGRLADHVVHVPSDDYGVVEDVHQSLMHCLTQYLRVLADLPRRLPARPRETAPPAP